MPALQPYLKQLQAFTISGLKVTAHPADGSFARLWEQLHQLPACQQAMTAGKPFYGMQEYLPALMAEGHWNYIAGWHHAGAPQDTQLVEQNVPANRYAVFEYQGMPGPALGELYEYIYKTWLPESGETLAACYDFEFYDERFLGPQNPESVLSIYIPVTADTA